MAYRMKRNGAGLATICVLGTMVLVMLSSTSCLYFGAEDSLKSRYPYDITGTLRWKAENSEPQLDIFRDKMTEIFEKKQIKITERTDYRYTSYLSYISDGKIHTDRETLNSVTPANADKFMRMTVIVPLEDYNREMNANEVLGDNEALLYVFRDKNAPDKFIMPDGSSYRVKKTLSEFMPDGDAAALTYPSYYIVVSDYTAAAKALFNNKYEQTAAMAYWKFGITGDCSEDTQREIASEYDSLIVDLGGSAGDYDSYMINAIATDRTDFYSTYGGLFFLGVCLSVVFLCAAVLIIYYKQLTEGYEDQSRFEIMQKVGMTKREIRRCVNSQMLTVFFLPPAAAGIHLAFAFPMLRRMLLLFGLFNLKPLIIACVITFAAFLALYLFVYRITAGAYYRIVSETEKG